MPVRSVYFRSRREVVVREEPTPSPGAGEVLVETTLSAVSPGTERLIYRGEAPRDLAADESLPALDGDLSYPLKYGYAAVGDVVAVGDGVADSWLGRTVFAFNPHESHFTAAPESLHPLPADVPPERAVFLPSVETAVTLSMDAAPVVGERVVVFGAGMIGLLTTHLLSQFPLRELLAVDPLPSRRELAARFGAHETVASEAAASRFDDGPVPGADLAVEVSGNPKALDDAIETVGYDGRVVVGSWYGTRRVDLDLGRHFHRGRIEVESSQVSTLDPPRRGRWTKERRLDVAWDRLRELPTDELPTTTVPVADAPRAYAEIDELAPETVGILFTYES